jgi:hypothetical protein
MKNTKTDNNEPILDAKLMEQLRMELYGTGLVDDNENDTNSSIFSRTKISSSTNVNGSMLVIGASVIGLLGMQFPFLFIKHAPFMATPSRKIQDAIKFLNHQKAAAVASTRTTPMASLSRTATPTSVAVAQRSSPSLPPPKPPIFVDLGSGDGQAVYEAAKLGHNAVGIEFNWTLWALSSLRRLFFWPSHVKRYVVSFLTQTKINSLVVVHTYTHKLIDDLSFLSDPIANSLTPILNANNENTNEKIQLQLQL